MDWLRVPPRLQTNLILCSEDMSGEQLYSSSRCAPFTLFEKHNRPCLPQAALIRDLARERQVTGIEDVYFVPRSRRTASQTIESWSEFQSINLAGVVGLVGTGDAVGCTASW